MTQKLSIVLKRGFHRLCPRCGKAKIFRKWGELYDRCPECGCVLKAREPDTWFFMYVSIAAITGIFIVLLMLILPLDQRAMRITIAFLSIGVFLGTQPIRKGLAIAIDYAVDSRLNHPKFPD